MIHTDRAHGIMYHHFYDEKHIKGQGAISADEFAATIEYYGRDRFVNAREWFEAAINRTLKPTDVCITFDDALLCQYDIALPVLRYFNLTAFWFVYTLPLMGGIGKLELYRKFRTAHFTDITEFYTSFHKEVDTSPYAELVESGLKKYNEREYLKDFTFYSKADKKFRFVRDMLLGPERYEEVMDLLIKRAKINVAEYTNELWMTKEQIQELHDTKHVVGLHSHTHPTAIAHLSYSDQNYQYSENHKLLTELLGEKPITMSHPNNSYNSDSLSILQQLGIKLGFRANMLKGFTGPYEYPREDHTNVVKLLKQ